MISITYYRKKCIGCNGCVEADPGRWRVSQKDGKCTLIGGKAKKGVFSARVGEEELNSLKAASENCPVNIIKYTLK